MKYWRLYNSAEKEVGFVPQIVEPVFEGYYTDDNQLLNKFSKQIENNTIIPKGHLHKRAKLTDLMSVGFGSGDFFLSDKLRIIIELFPFMGVQFVSTQIITNIGEFVKSNIMHSFSTDRSFIDMANTEFEISTVGGELLNDRLKFSSMKDFMEIREAHIAESKKYKDIKFHKWITISKLSFKEDVDFGLCSIFDIKYGGLGFFVSQQLKDEILINKCTGVIFREINESYP